MSDDTFKRGLPDASRVNVHEEREVRYWTKKIRLCKRAAGRRIQGDWARCYCG